MQFLTNLVQKTWCRCASRPPPFRVANKIFTTEHTENTENKSRKFREPAYRRLSLNKFPRSFFAAPSPRHFQFLRGLGDLRGWTFVGVCPTLGGKKKRGPKAPPMVLCA